MIEFILFIVIFGLISHIYSLIKNDIQVQIVKIARTALLPVAQTTGSAGFDLHAIHFCRIAPLATAPIRVGVGIQIPVGYVGLIMPRSGLSKKGIMVHPGVVDSDYRGELAVLICNLTDKDFFVQSRMRIAQLLIVPNYNQNLTEIPEFNNQTVRGI